MILPSDSDSVSVTENDTRIRQATRWATALGISGEELLPQIPEISASFLSGPRQTRLGTLDLLTLVPFGMGNVRATNAAGLKYQWSGFGYMDGDEILIPSDDQCRFPRDWRWILAHDGGPNLDRRPDTCFAECVDGFFAGVDKVGIAIWLQHGPRKHGMDLPGSVFAGSPRRRTCACVDPFDDGPELGFFRRIDLTSPRCGSVVFVRE